MEITEIKQRLTLATVLHYYGLKPDKQLRLCCPFHKDKTPSMQIYYKTHTAYCFSSNCSTHGKSLDVIEFVQRMENTDKHNGIVKCTELLGTSTQEKTTSISQRPTQIQTPSRTQFLGNIYTYFKNAVHNSKSAKAYLEKRGLDFLKIEVGYNSGQFHHGTRKDEQLIENCLQVGLLLDENLVSRTGTKAYRPFGKHGIAFALKNRSNQVTGFYFRSTVNEENAKHFYLKDSTGLYPGYPKQDTQILIVTESIIDGASLLQYIKTLRKAIRTEQLSILSAYGTNRLNDEMITAITELKELKEIVFAFDMDEAGTKQLQNIQRIFKHFYQIYYSQN